ncbi:MAG: twin-arginine translocase subunit TatC [Kiritimatiellia bacterium]|nr:twin-arginine translocase subunit TatC [Kiritimatiellia bacterium]MDP6631524.1 twin-arginine translocase subunit TatC [Kiritimatiellia bacterium]MDP6810584.1 twin-arginine translocase subunit TatC [Kiritimatiellia bacterium]MDP7022829.1 twin-arginine translocase subunit TatC [Kiritimatiellia bacterium]
MPAEELDSYGTKPFVEHLDDLRRTILWSLIALGAGMAFAFPLAPYVLKLLKVPVAQSGVDPETFLRVLRVAGGLSITLRIGFWGGLLLALPFILLAVGWFVFPGLTQRERRAIRNALGMAVVLFAAGVSFGYFLVLPSVVQLMLRINEWLGLTCDFVELADYVSFVLRLLIAFGLAYELPVVIVVLGHLGIVTSASLRAYRRHVIVGLLVAAMLLTPPDPLSQIMMALPLVVLYEICIWIVWVRQRAAMKSKELE